MSRSEKCDWCGEESYVDEMESIYVVDDGMGLVKKKCLRCRTPAMPIPPELEELRKMCSEPLSSKPFVVIRPRREGENMSIAKVTRVSETAVYRRTYTLEIGLIGGNYALTLSELSRAMLQIPAEAKLTGIKTASDCSVLLTFVHDTVTEEK